MEFGWNPFDLNISKILEIWNSVGYALRYYAVAFSQQNIDFPSIRSTNTDTTQDGNMENLGHRHVVDIFALERHINEFV